MSNNYAQSTFAPQIPKHLISNEDRLVLEAFNVTLEPVGEDRLYLYAGESCTSALLDLADGGIKEMDEDDLHALLQKIIRRSNGEITWISQETAFTNDKMRADEFGGAAVFITADDVQWTGTSSWLQQRIAEVETGDSGPGAEDDNVITKNN